MLFSDSIFLQFDVSSKARSTNLEYPYALAVIPWVWHVVWEPGGSFHIFLPMGGVVGWNWNENNHHFFLLRNCQQYQYNLITRKTEDVAPMILKNTWGHMWNVLFIIKRKSKMYKGIITIEIECCKLLFDCMFVFSYLFLSDHHITWNGEKTRMMLDPGRMPGP